MAFDKRLEDRHDEAPRRSPPMKIKNEEGYQHLLAVLAAKRAGTPPPLAPGEPAKPPPRRRAAPARGETVSLADLAEPPAEIKKRQGVKETPILASLHDCAASVECSPTHATLLFDGARLFTLNEIYALLQYRSYIVFSYKKQWHALVRNALLAMGRSKPHFDGPCKVTLFRQGRKSVDRDSLMVMFKYIIDALKDEPKHGFLGLFPDDNPDIVYEDEKIQTLGPPMVGIRIDVILPAPSPSGKDGRSLFNRSAPEFSAPPPPPPKQPKAAKPRAKTPPLGDSENNPEQAGPRRASRKKTSGG